MAIDRNLTFTLGEIMDALEVVECRLSGMHDPTHTLRHFCREQQAHAFDSLLEFLGVKMEDLPRRLSPYTHQSIEETTKGDRAGYSTTKDREKQIRLLAWEAGAPMEIFREANDVVTEEKTERLLSVLTDEYQSWQKVTAALHERYPDFVFPMEWYYATVAHLIEQGKIEGADISIRQTQET